MTDYYPQRLGMLEGSVERFLEARGENRKHALARLKIVVEAVKSDAGYLKLRAEDDAKHAAWLAEHNREAANG